MRNKLLLIFFLVLPISFLAFFSLNLSRNVPETQVKIAAEGFDPRDLLSGRYIYLRLNWDKTDCKQFLNKICPKEKFERAYRFYLPEIEADQADALLQKEDVAFELVFNYTPDDMPHPADLLINGEPWKQFFNRF